MKKACVIGGSGFLGSHVCDQLTSAGYEVIIYDRALSPWISDGQSMVVADIHNESALNKAIAGCEVVYNFAAIAHLDEALRKPIETINVNILGNAIALEACRKHGVTRYMYASTVYVYSREGGFYRCSKLAAEQFVEEYQKQYGLDFTVLRYGSLYGPRSDKHNGLWRIVKRALDEKKVIYEGSPEAIRQYIHVKDAARASVAALNENFRNQHVILTGQEKMHIVDLLKMLAEILGLPQEIDFIDSSHAGHYIRTPYAYQAQLGLKYSPLLHVDLGQGLIELINDIQKEALSKEGIS